MDITSVKSTFKLHLALSALQTELDAIENVFNEKLAVVRFSPRLGQTKAELQGIMYIQV